MDNSVLIQDMKEVMEHVDIKTTMKYVHTNDERKTNSARIISEKILFEHKKIHLINCMS